MSRGLYVKAFSLIALLALAGLMGCGQATTEETTSTAGSVELVRSEKSRVQSAAGDVETTAVAQGGTQFALSLFREVRSPDTNLAFSPYSLTTALAMTLAGARAETEEEMLAALAIPLPAEEIHPALNGLARELEQSAEVSKENDLELTLRQAASLWGQQGEGFIYRPAFLDLLAEQYGAGLRLVEDLSSEDARLHINDWAAKETAGLVLELLPPGALTKGPPIYLVLANTLSLSAPWHWPFSPEATSPGPFHLLDGTTRQVPMMHQNMPFPYAEGNDYQAVELPYVGGEFGMVILLPAPGRFEEFTRTLDASRLQEILGDLDAGEEAPPLTLPRFSVEWSGSLKGALRALGMEQAFDPSLADFSGMNGQGGLWVDDAYQAARVSVDEVGTEAAAGSAVVMAARAGGEQMVVDRPFLFLVRHRPTGEMLFLGQVVDPGGGQDG
ncbi:MAG: serpin family protein [Thermoleophilia bacterium]|nr:serpin family protein [Thermoleophilia bacterium]